MFFIVISFELPTNILIYLVIILMPFFSLVDVFSFWILHIFKRKEYKLEKKYRKFKENQKK